MSDLFPTKDKVLIRDCYENHICRDSDGMVGIIIKEESGKIKWTPTIFHCKMDDDSVVSCSYYDLSFISRNAYNKSKGIPYVEEPKQRRQVYSSGSLF